MIEKCSWILDRIVEIEIAEPVGDFTLPGYSVDRDYGVDHHVLFVKIK
jgi:hypothetical protein